MGDADLRRQHELVALGLATGDAVMIHASMRAVGGRAEALVEALLAVLGDSGTLMAYVDYELTANAPVFDPEHSPSAFDHGVLAEVIRRWPHAVRSLNPGASVAAIGAQAEWLCREHPLSYGYGLGSPFSKFVELGGKIVLLGSDPDHVTMLHHAEHIARLSNKRVVRTKIETIHGPVEVEEFDTSNGVVAIMPQRYFATVTEAFTATGAVQSGWVGGAQAFVLPAGAFVRFAVEKMEREFTKAPSPTVIP
jgi:aminoglycoside 3-N-acetyltransferase